MYEGVDKTLIVIDGKPWGKKKHQWVLDKVIVWYFIPFFVHFDWWLME